MLRLFIGIAVLALVLRALSGCTVNVINPTARAAPAPPPPRTGINPCGIVNCKRPNTWRIV